MPRTRASHRPRSALAGLRWAFRAPEEEILAALARGRQRRALREYFGEARYAELCALAARAERAAVPRRRVLLVPGMMGSRLGHPGRIVWIDPERIGAGELVRLALSTGRALTAQGVLLHPYVRLLLSLRIAGFAPELFPYDWRLGLDELGRMLAARLSAPHAPRLLIAHSMGGLVARAALRHLPARHLERLILLGTPNGGCFDPVLALRGTHPFVRSLAQLDARHDAARLAAVFRTFEGLHDLLPDGAADSLDLLDARAWPRTGPRPDGALLGRARRTRARLAPASARMVHIAGFGQLTIERAQHGPGGLAYVSSAAGDGTVPLARARLRGLRMLYVEALHGDLAHHPEVIRAIIELLRDGATRRLARRVPHRPSSKGHTDDARLAGGAAAKVDWRGLSRAQRARILEQLDGVPRTPQGTPARRKGAS